MMNRLRWPLMVLLIAVSVVFSAPVKAQNPLETLTAHEIANDVATRTAEISGSTEVSSSVFSKFLERINQLFAKISTLASRVNELMDRLAKVNEQKAAQAQAAQAIVPADPVQSSKPSSSSPTSASPSTSSTSTVSGVAAKVAEVAASYPSRYSTAQSFKYAAGTENGNLGCANVVSAALREAGVPIKLLLGVSGVWDALLKLKEPDNWKKVSAPPFQPGDVVIWAIPPGKKHRHIGIAAKNGNTVMAMNNSSSKRHPVFSACEYRAVECVLRKA